MSGQADSDSDEESSNYDSGEDESEVNVNDDFNCRDDKDIPLFERLQKIQDEENDEAFSNKRSVKKLRKQRAVGKACVFGIFSGYSLVFNKVIYLVNASLQIYIGCYKISDG